VISLSYLFLFLDVCVVDLCREYDSDLDSCPYECSKTGDKCVYHYCTRQEGGLCLCCEYTFFFFFLAFLFYFIIHFLYSDTNCTHPGCTFDPVPKKLEHSNFKLNNLPGTCIIDVCGRVDVDAGDECTLDCLQRSLYGGDVCINDDWNCTRQHNEV
jgi:hypothetical protein